MQKLSVVNLNAGFLVCTFPLTTIITEECFGTHKSQWGVHEFLK